MATLADIQKVTGAQTLADILGQMSGSTVMHQRLGEFICNYAQCEQALHLIFDKLSKLPPEVAREIMGGARLHELIAALNKLVEASDAVTDDQRAEYKTCIEQLNHITKLRHRLIHRGATAEQERITSTNELVAKSREAVEILNFHVDALKDAAVDCFNMELRLLYVISPNVKTKLEDIRDKVFGAWRYKPVQPMTPNRPPRKTRPKSQRQ